MIGEQIHVLTDPIDQAMRFESQRTSVRPYNRRRRSPPIAVASVLLIAPHARLSVACSSDSLPSV